MLLLPLLVLLSSCKDEIDDFADTASITSTEDFAKALSEAVYGEPALRTFIKKEALIQFDRDNDVLYANIRFTHITQVQ